MINIRCAICNEPLAQANPLYLHRPLLGAMFLSPDPFHGFEPPFTPTTEWLGMLCPYCRHRPFVNEEEVLTDTGIYRLPSGPNPFEAEAEPEPEPSPIDSAYWEPRECPECGRVVKGIGPMAAHRRVHQ